MNDARTHAPTRQYQCGALTLTLTHAAALERVAWLRRVAREARAEGAGGDAAWCEEAARLLTTQIHEVAT